MISRKFSNLSDTAIAGMIGGGKDAETVTDAVASMTDLWVLANIKETYETYK